jgi:AcrR family transcriptional regulator
MSEDGNAHGEFDAALELLWTAPKVKTRGPKPVHALGDVLDAAIRVADSEGLDAVSMQRLAQELGFTKMAVYRYVPGRSELIALMTDRAIGRPSSISKGKSWREKMEGWALAVFSVFLAHPWGLEATTGRRMPGPLEIAWVETGLAILAETGLDGLNRLDVLAVITGHLRFMASQAGGRGPTIGLEAELNGLMSRALHGRETEFPQFSAAIHDAAARGAEDNGLSFGLKCILDGIEWQLSKR